MSRPPVFASAPVRIALGCLCALTWLAAFAATHIPPGRGGGLFISDKLLHFIGYLGLATPLIWLLAALGHTRPWRIALTLGILLAYGVFDELTQPLVGRSADVLDWLCDAAGIAASVALWEVIFAIRQLPRGRNRTPDA